MDYDTVLSPNSEMYETDFEVGVAHSPSIAVYQQTMYIGFLDPNPWRNQGLSLCTQSKIE